MWVLVNEQCAFWPLRAAGGQQHAAVIFFQKNIHLNHRVVAVSEALTFAHSNSVQWLAYKLQILESTVLKCAANNCTASMKRPGQALSINLQARSS
jgi:hypothetical protein